MAGNTALAMRCPQTTTSVDVVMAEADIPAHEPLSNSSLPSYEEQLATIESIMTCYETPVTQAAGYVNGEESIERKIGEAAEGAARAMCPNWLTQRLEDNHFEHFCPVLKTMPKVQMIGLVRLRYRLQTRRTSAWFAQLQEFGDNWIKKYHDLAVRARPSAASRTHDRDSDWLDKRA